MKENTVVMPKHYLSNIWYAAQMLKKSESILDRREGEVLEKLYYELDKQK